MNTNRDIRSTAKRLLADVDMTPLSARSLLLSYLLGTHPPDVPTARLVAFGELFGLRAGTVRTALSRMTANGDLIADDGRYRLANRFLDRQREYDRGQRQLAGSWNGEWWTVLVTADARTVGERRRFRVAVERALLGELRPDTWMRPSNLDSSESPSPVDAAAVDGSSAIVTRGPLTVGDGPRLAERLWDIAAIESRSAAIREALAPLGAALGRADDDGDHDALGELLPLSFEVSAAAVRHLRVEPQLPDELADTSASQALRASYAEVNTTFRTALDRHLRR